MPHLELVGRSVEDAGVLEDALERYFRLVEEMLEVLLHLQRVCNVTTISQRIAKKNKTLTYFSLRQVFMRMWDRELTGGGEPTLS